MAEAADPGDHNDEGKQRQDKHPDCALECEDNAGSNDRAHDQPDQNRQQKFHPHRWYEESPQIQVRTVAILGLSPDVREWLRGCNPLARVARL